MKTLILLLLPIALSGQLIRPNPGAMEYQQDAAIVVRTPNATTHIYDDLHLLNKRTAITAGLSIVSGLFYGIHETVVHKPNRIPDTWNRQWWDSRESWRNKYEGGDPVNGAAFPGSRGALVWTTDAKHLFGGAYRATMFGAGVSIGIGERRRFRDYAKDALVSAVCFQAGFMLAYNTNLIFR